MTIKVREALAMLARAGARCTNEGAPDSVRRFILPDGRRCSVATRHGGADVDTRTVKLLASIRQNQ